METTINNAQHEIGTRYMTRGKAPRECTVIDILETYNNAGEHVRTRYVSTHEFLGQTITNRDVVPVAVSMGLIAKRGAA